MLDGYGVTTMGDEAARLPVPGEDRHKDGYASAAEMLAHMTPKERRCYTATLWRGGRCWPIIRDQRK